MWLLLSDRPRTPPIQFKGRRWLSLVDAIVWPLLAWGVLGRFSADADFVGLWSIATPVLLACWCVRRVKTAFFVPASYVFSTWLVTRWLGWAVLALLIVKAST